MINRQIELPYQTGGKTASGAGDMGFKSRADQISHTCQRLATVATFIVWALAQDAEMGTAHSWHPKG